VAPPVGTLRVGRYFLALAALFAVLYTVVFLSTPSTPKLGLDLVGGIRVIFTAQTPKGSPAPTSSQMTQARQILEDRINGTGVTGSTVVVQGSNQLVVEIPNGTSTDVAKLGKAAILNFRGVMAPAQAVSCTPLTGAGSSSSPSASTSPSTSGSPGAPATASGSASTTATSLGSVTSPSTTSTAHTADAAGERPLAAPTTTPKTTPKTTPTATKTPTGSGTAKASTTATPTGSTATTAAPTPCIADPFAALFKADTALQGQLEKLYSVPATVAGKPVTVADLMPNAESCPSPAQPTNKDLPKAAQCRAYSALTSTQQQEMASALSQLDCNSTQTEPDNPDAFYFACDDGTTYGAKVAFLLGHVIVPGRLIGSATAQAPNGTNLAWTVSLNLTSSGGNHWHDWTSKYNTTDSTASPVQTSTTAPCGPTVANPCSDFVGFTLDGVVISSPVTEAVLDQNTSISGNFTASTAKALARELNYGKLPVSFRTDADEHVSATLGNKQLKAAFLAGGIGLALVVVYSLLYYRFLGFVTIASLLVSGGLTYAMLVILGKQIGFTLDLAGIAGFIVALGITADSFVVFFERLKDEVHEGRSVRVAVPRAWIRARRTILSADTVSFLAAATLYYFASADVKGFAFTLGMSTILDLVVVFLFTHPLVSWLSRKKAFGSARFTGLNSVREGGIAEHDVDDPPVRPAKAAQRSAPEPRVPTGKITIEKSALAVLDPETDEAQDAEDAAEPDSAADVEPDTVEEAGAAASDEVDDADGDAATDVNSGADSDADSDTADEEPDEPRRRTKPAPGSAAERAAARRARLREKGGS
jgi:preprotein translocase subunit SecD